MRNSVENKGMVFLAGAGPGDPGLLTVRAAGLLAEADAVVYDYLVHPGLLENCRADCEKIYVGKKAGFHAVPQEEIERILVRKAGEGKTVVRLKGGDPFVYGRGGEEARTLAAAGIRFEVVPGVTAAIAAGACAGIPLTQRNTSSAVVFLTGHEDPEKKNLVVDWGRYGALDATLCIYMGMGRLAEIVSQLIAGGRPADTPAAVVQWASLPRQRSLVSTLGAVAEDVTKAGLSSPAVVFVGKTAARSAGLNWFESRPLFGRRIVVTRNRERAGELAAKLERLGAEVLEIPLIDVKPDISTEIANEVFEEFWSYDWLVFSSANGVKFFFEEFFRRYRDLRALGGVRLAAIGRATAREIESFRLEVDLVPDISTAEGLADALIATESLDSAKAVVVTGNRNRDVLVNKLHDAQAIVDVFPVYRTDLADVSGNLVAADFRRRGADLIVYTSSSAAASFARHAEALKLEEGARTPKAASIGALTSAKLRSFGVPVAIEARKQSLDSLVDEIVRAVANGTLDAY